jgi:hypothetical protein
MKKDIKRLSDLMRRFNKSTDGRQSGWQGKTRLLGVTTPGQKQEAAVIKLVV